jgi:hypothetical protein
LGDVCGIASPHRNDHQNGWQSWYILSIVFLFAVALVAAGAIRIKWSPDGSIQWLPAKPWIFYIGRCRVHCSNASAWPSKWPATEIFVLTLNVAKGPWYSIKTKDES